MDKRSDKTDPPTDPQVIEVEAQIDAWRSGAYGPFANATILTKDAPATSATCSQSVNGLEPPLGVPFRCAIKLKANGKGYGIVELLIEGLPAELAGIEASVKERKGIDLLLQAVFSPERSIQLILPAKVLGASQMGDIPPDYPVVVDAIRGAAGYEATVLHTPTIADVLDPAGSPVTLVCPVSSRWHAHEEKSNGAYVNVTSESGLMARLWVKKSLLSAAGIRSLHLADSRTTHDRPDDRQRLNAFETVLREGRQEELERLEIDRLELSLEWVEAKGQWRVCRLVAPLSLREPACEGEIIGWVEGITDGAPQTASGGPRNVPAAQEHAEAEPVTPTSYQFITIAFQDRRLGRGQVRYSGEERIAAAGLADGVPVVMSLVGKGRFWRIRTLHRSRPTENEAAP